MVNSFLTLSSYWAILMLCQGFVSLIKAFNHKNSLYQTIIYIFLFVFGIVFGGSIWFESWRWYPDSLRLVISFFLMHIYLIYTTYFFYKKYTNKLSTKDREIIKFSYYLYFISTTFSILALGRNSIIYITGGALVFTPQLFIYFMTIVSLYYFVKKYNLFNSRRYIENTIEDIGFDNKVNRDSLDNISERVIRRSPIKHSLERKAKPQDKISLKEKLLKLKELFDEELISKEEYNKKREELLNSIDWLS